MRITRSIARVFQVPTHAAVLVLIGLAASPTTTQAQGTATDAGSKESATLQEIVVTAVKRATTVQSTPMSITATTGQDLLDSGISSVEDLAKRTPGAAIQSQGPGRSFFVIRGMTPSGGAAPTVGYYLDDTPVSPPPQALAPAGKSVIDPNLYDLSRVEVLRGPQGTLYGAGSMGGTIRLITNAPDPQKFDASAQALASQTDHGGVNAGGSLMLNLPVGEKFAFRLVGTERYDDGFIDRIVVPNFPPPSPDYLTRGDVAAATPSRIKSDVNDAHTQSVRGSFLAQLTDELSLRGGVFHQRLIQHGQNTIDIPPGKLAHYQPFDLAEGYSDAFTLYNLSVKFANEVFSVESATALITRKTQNVNDDTENYYTLFTGPAGFFTPGPTYVNHDSREISEELRVSSVGSGKLQWIVGGFYDRFTDNLLYNEEAPALTPLFGIPQIFDFYEADRIKQYALFGELNYNLTEHLVATLGLRYFKYTYDFRQLGNGIVVAPILENVVGTSSASGTTPKVTLAYLPDQNTTFYISASKGFRPGAPNGPIPGNVPGANCGDALAALGLTSAPQSYAPDTVWNYEIGEKLSLLDRRLQINSAIYHIKWNNVQQQVALSCGFAFTANAGTAKSDGAELEIVGRVAKDWTLRQSLGYTNARITEQLINTGSGSRLQSVPKWTVNTAVEFRHALNSSWTMNANANYQYTSQEFDPTAAPYDFPERPSFSFVNARLGLEHGKLSAALFADNLTNRQAIYGFSAAQSANIPSMTRAIVSRPRTIGLDFQWKY